MLGAVVGDVIDSVLLTMMKMVKRFLNRFENNETFTCAFLTSCYTGMRTGDDDDKIRLNQRKPSKYKGLSRFGPEKTCNESTNL